jgi:hypothetical protein
LAPRPAFFQRWLPPKKEQIEQKTLQTSKLFPTSPIVTLLIILLCRWLLSAESCFLEYLKLVQSMKSGNKVSLTDQKKQADMAKFCVSAPLRELSSEICLAVGGIIL